MDSLAKILAIVEEGDAMDDVVNTLLPLTVWCSSVDAWLTRCVGGIENTLDPVDPLRSGQTNLCLRRPPRDHLRPILGTFR